MPKQSRTDAFNAHIQSVLEKSSFADPNCGSWYKNKDGKITNNWSGTVIEYQDLLSKVAWDDFETTDALGAKRSASQVVFGDGRKESEIGRVREESYVGTSTLLLGAVGTVLAGAAWYAGLGRRVSVAR